MLIPVLATYYKAYDKLSTSGIIFISTSYDLEQVT